MPSAPPSSSSTVILMAATRTVATARIALSSQAAATITTPPNKTFALRVLQHPLRPTKQFPLNQFDHRAPFAQQKRRSWSTDAD